MNSDSLCCALYPEAILPLSQAPFSLYSAVVLLRMHLMAAFYSELHWRASTYVIPVLLSLLLPSGFCLLFVNFLQPWRWVEKGKGLLYKIKVHLEWTLSRIF